MSAVGERIKDRRLVLGWSQKTLGEKSRYGQASVSKIEAGSMGISLEQAVAFASVLNVGINYLATGTTGFIPDDRYADGYRDGVLAAKSALEALVLS